MKGRVRILGDPLNEEFGWRGYALAINEKYITGFNICFKRFFQCEVKGGSK